MRTLSKRLSSPSYSLKRPFEIYRVLMLAVSAVAIVAAGSLANASTSTMNLSFAKAEINRSESLLTDLTERADNEMNAAEFAKIGKEVAALNRGILEAQSALEKAERSPRKVFIREELRATILNLQATANHALAVAINADIYAEDAPTQTQFFRVSRTGQ